MESHAAAVREGLGIAADLPGTLALGQLGAYLRDRVEIEDSPVRFGFCLHRPDGTCVVWAPRGERYAESVLHEICHAIWWNGLARLLDLYGHPVARTQRWREEYACDRFARAFLLPPALVHAYPDDHELAEVASCSLELVRQRRRDLAE
jgi:hypothetical protein